MPKTLGLPVVGKLPNIRNVQIQTHSRCNADCVFCFAPETQILTPDGDMPIKALVGKATLLVPARAGFGGWREVTVKSFGVQSLLTVHLRRGRSIKTIRVTADHRWPLVAVTTPVTTKHLKAGDRIQSCFARATEEYGNQPYMSSVAAAQGFVFGDGSRLEGRYAPAEVCLYAEKDKAMLPYFAACRRKYVKVNGGEVCKILDLPRSWKDQPQLNESKSFMLGWLAGYFAADGHVTKNGRQATIYSANKSNISLFKTICYHLGVRVSPVCSKVRVGFGQSRPLHYASFAVRDVPIEFWLQEHHRDRVRAVPAQPGRERVFHWTVVQVEDIGEREEVFCAVVPDVEKFTLADNLLTYNCPYIESEHAANHGRMTDAMWHHVLNNLRPFTAGLNEGKVAPYLMQEPLIDKTIFDKIRDIYRCFPRTCVEVSTNGAALTDQVVDKLFECFDGKRHDLWVSHHGIDKASLEHIMKIDFDKAQANLINLLKKNNGRFTVKIRGAGQSRDKKHTIFTRQQYLEHWKELFALHNINTRNVSVDAFTFHDRAGELHREDRGACNLNMGTVRQIDKEHPFHCGRIDEWLHIMYDGTIRICCMDYSGSVKLPSLKDTWLVEYFQSDEYRDLCGWVGGQIQHPKDFICTRCSSPGG